MELITALLNLDPAALVTGGLAIVALRCVASGSDSECDVEDDRSDYDNASWNPSSVNYNG